MPPVTSLSLRSDSWDTAKLLHEVRSTFSRKGVVYEPFHFLSPDKKFSETLLGLKNRRRNLSFAIHLHRKIKSLQVRILEGNGGWPEVTVTNIR